MKHRYLPMTEQDRQDMMAEIGIKSVEELFADIPAPVRFQGILNVSSALSEPELLKHTRRLVEKNADTDRYTSFLGAGIYDHHIPAVIQHVISRSEFYTAYTPYQPEISQGELQAIFEFQSYICELTAMAAANASMYDALPLWRRPESWPAKPPNESSWSSRGRYTPNPGKPYVRRHGG